MWKIKGIKNEYHINAIKPNYRVSIDLPQKLEAFLRGKKKRTRKELKYNFKNQ